MAGTDEHAPKIKTEMPPRKKATGPSGNRRTMTTATLYRHLLDFMAEQDVDDEAPVKHLKGAFERVIIDEAMNG